MKAALTIWRDRISPVFDVAGRFLFVEFAEEGIVSRTEAVLQQSTPAQRAALLRQQGTDLLICGAISRQGHMALESESIRVISHVCGPVEQVLAALLSGGLERDDRWCMPGCGLQRRRRRRRRHGHGER